MVIAAEMFEFAIFMSYVLSSLMRKCAPQLQKLTRVPEVALKSHL